MSDKYDLGVAFIASVPPTVAALSALQVSLRNNKQLKGNGNGTHTEMLENTMSEVNDLAFAFQEHVIEDREAAQEMRQQHAVTIGRLDDVIETQNSIIRRILK